MAACFVGGALFAGAGMLHDHYHYAIWDYISFLGFILGFGSIYFSCYGYRCPQCGNTLYDPASKGNALSFKGNHFSFATKTRCCPYCSFDFDSPVPEKKQMDRQALW